MDDLEEFAMAYMQRGRHGDIGNREDDYRERERDRYPFYCSKGSPARRPPSPPPLPGKKRDAWGNGQAQRDPRERDQSRRDYDPAFLNSLLERKAKAVKSSASTAGQTEEDSDTPSKKSRNSRTPSNQSPRQRTAEDNESLPPYSEELERSCGPKSVQQNRSLKVVSYL